MSEGHPAARFFGWLLTALGGLWVLLTGGCTLTLVAGQAGGLSHSNVDALVILGVYLLIGAVCVAPGAGLLIWGLYLLRRSKLES